MEKRQPQKAVAVFEPCGVISDVVDDVGLEVQGYQLS